MMIYLDGFSGYGGFRLGLEQAGFVFEKVYFSEIDKHAIACYKKNFPNSIYAGSITTISKRTIPHIDIFTFGWPCQGNSVAGERGGLDGHAGSGLLYEAVRVINEFKPRFFIAENVPGLLSVNKGIDIVKSLRLLSIFNESVPQYDIEMQLFNTRWFLPQNRERLFFIGHLRGNGVRQIFPIGEDIIRANEGAGKTPTVRTLMVGGQFRGNAQHNDITAYIKNNGVIQDMDISTAIDANYYKGADNHGQRTLIRKK